MQRRNLMLLLGAGSTLSAMRAESLTSGTPESARIVGTVAELLRQVGSDNATAMVLGYHAPDDGGGGVFYWDSKSTENPDEGVVFAPSGGQGSGRWRRLLDGNSVSVRWFGARGDWDGRRGTDDSTACQSALNHVIQRGGRLHVPAGAYLLNRLVEYEGPDRMLSVVGDGVGVTQLVVPEGSHGGALSLRFQNRASQVTVTDLSFVSYAAGAGTALTINQPPGGDRHNRTVYLENVEVRGADPSLHYFLNGLDLTGCWRPLLAAVAVGGPFSPAVHEKPSSNSIMYAMRIGINLDQCYEPDIRDTYVWSCRVGITSINDHGRLPEAFNIRSSRIVGVMTGIEFRRAGYAPTLWMRDCHVNFVETGVHLRGCRLILISGTAFYNEIADAGVVATDISLDECRETIIESNFFHQDGNPVRTHIAIGSGAEKTMIIQGNIFNAQAETAIHFTDTEDQVKPITTISGNIMSGRIQRPIVYGK